MSIITKIENITKETIRKRDVLEYIEECLYDIDDIKEGSTYTISQIFNEYDWIEVNYIILVNTINKYDDGIINNIEFDIVDVCKA